MTRLETFHIELYFALALTLPACFAQELPVAKFTTTVTDESGTPLSKARVGFSVAVFDGEVEVETNRQGIAVIQKASSGSTLRCRGR